jgi:hypothetical protein
VAQVDAVLHLLGDGDKELGWERETAMAVRRRVREVKASEMVD